MVEAPTTVALVACAGRAAGGLPGALAPLGVDPGGGLSGGRLGRLAADAGVELEPGGATIAELRLVLAAGWRDVPRLVGLTRTIRALAPDWLVPLFVVLTELGNPGAFLLGASLLYWFRDRGPAAYLMGLTVGGLAVGVALKWFFALPRPTLPGFVLYAEGYGFPSGHALGATVFYGGLATILDVGTRRLRYAAAGGLVTFVGVTRVVLGAHYVGDVVAGALVGIAYLALVVGLTRGDPGRSFAVAVPAGVAAFVATDLPPAGPHPAGTAIAGTALGAAVTWGTLHSSGVLDLTRPPEALPGGGDAPIGAAAVGVPAIAVLGYVSAVATPSLAVTFAAAFLIPVVVFGLPVATGYVAAPR